MRNSFIICYDICDPKRLRHVYKTMCGWGDRFQYSVFYCELSATELIECRQALSDIIHHEDDHVLFVDLGPAVGRGTRVIDYLGKPPRNEDPESDENCFVS